MDRLIKKYEVFFRIMLENPHNIAVPTLDVDLAWLLVQAKPSESFPSSTLSSWSMNVRLQPNGTFDVLAWHTHQLSPSRYYKYSTSNVPFGCKRTFIDHDDRD
jgi:hypothetical protein